MSVAAENKQEEKKQGGKPEFSLYAKSAVLMDADSGRVLYGKDEESFLPNASTTKIMTCILAIESGKLEDTVIVLSADHYPYGLTDEEYSELLGHPVDPVFEIYENTLILWSADMEEPVYVEKPCSSLDVMPTLSNLFGLEFDSRLVIGTDILSDSPGLVIFSNYSFLNQEGAYNSITDQFTRWDGQSPDLDRVTAMVADVQNRVAYSAVILDYDYYRLALNGPPKEEAFPPSS